MKLSNLTTIAGAVGAVLVLVLPSAGRGGAYPDRPPPAHTGGFGEPPCAQCPFGSPPLRLALVAVTQKPTASARAPATA